MTSTPIPSQIRERVRRYLSLRVLVLWSALTVLVVVFAYVAVAPRFNHVGAMGLALLCLFLIGLFRLNVGERVETMLSEKWEVSLLGVVFFGVAALPIPLRACFGASCSGTRELHVFYDWSLFGPAIAVSFAADLCAHLCPHRVQLLPLTIGYLFLAEAVTKEQS
ncbi:hypothetical protein [Haloarchaeobius litoreus]|uniref:Uncharacterized protein n=1 Tax=Haloarchaeobius litoreus TaxID=755306 RepID=A0ABD6DJB9_9EURY|nr:hypothetical protein [Haloarchaeobius litoreus]